MTAASIGSKDPQFTTPFVDVDEWRDDPVRHRYVHGGFEGTDTKFSMYFPPEERLRGPVLPAPHAHLGHREHGPARARRDDGRVDRLRRRQRGVPGRVEPRAHGDVPRRRPHPGRLPGQRRGRPLLPRARRGDVRRAPRLRLRLRRQRRRLQDHRLHREHRRRLGRGRALRPRLAAQPAQPLHRPGPRHPHPARRVPPDRRRRRGRGQRRPVDRPLRRAARGPGRGDPDGLPPRRLVRRRAGRGRATRACSAA